MSNEAFLKIKTEEQLMYDEVANLLILDGWQKLTKDIDEQYVLVFTVYGEIVHRFVTWESEWSEWHYQSFDYPSLWLTEEMSILDDVDDYSVPLVVSLKVPARTKNTVQALKILEDYYDKEQDNVNMV